MPQIDNNKSYTRELVRLNNYNLIAIGYEKLSLNLTVKALTVPDNARYAILKLESNITAAGARYLELGDKMPPSATDGISLSNNDVVSIDGYQNLINFRITRTAGISVGTLHIQYYK